MKSILYAGAVLMTGACIYGFTEFSNSDTKEALKDMYKDEKTLVQKTDITGVQPEVTAVVAETKPEVAVRKKEVRAKEEPVVEKKLTPPEIIEEKSAATIEKSEVDLIPPVKMAVKKKKKRLNSKMFSRAPIREHEEELILVPEKKEEVKATKEL